MNLLEQTAHCRAICDYRCPKYEELPALGLYKDQVVCLLNQYVDIFYDEETPVTATMVNNYVKMKLITPPVRKKYDREQIASLYLVFLLKQVLSISEIARLLGQMLEEGSMEQMYACLCQELEQALRGVFGHQLSQEEEPATPVQGLLRAAVCSLAHKIYFITMLPQLEEEPLYERVAP